VLVDEAVQAEPLHLEHGPWIAMGRNADDPDLGKLGEHRLRASRPLPSGSEKSRRDQSRLVPADRGQPIAQVSAGGDDDQPDGAQCSTKKFRNQALVLDHDDLRSRGGSRIFRNLRLTSRVGHTAADYRLGGSKQAEGELRVSGMRPIAIGLRPSVPGSAGGGHFRERIAFAVTRPRAAPDWEYLEPDPVRSGEIGIPLSEAIRGPCTWPGAPANDWRDLRCRAGGRTARKGTVVAIDDREIRLEFAWATRRRRRANSLS